MRGQNKILDLFWGKKYNKKCMYIFISASIALSEHRYSMEKASKE